METASYLYIMIVYNIVYGALKSPRSEGEGVWIGWGYDKE